MSKAEHENRQRSHYAEGSGGATNGSGPTFVMKHKANSMKESTSKPNEVWYVDAKASNHMTSDVEWFSYSEKPEQQGIVETGDDTPHTIKHVGISPPQSCRKKRETNELDNNKEPSVNRTDRRLGDASLIRASRMFHRRRGQSHCARASRREDVHPQH